ncbi:MAG: 50S ribosomal protein L19e [Candidatus Aenigmarchaeota archaeon]|nr:50S ribosomal protein L19e [Candidatus Aenigmarchaeota archaeon]
MNTTIQRRIAAKILKCGANRVWIDPQKLKDVSEAITREDVRKLIGSGAIVKSAEEAPSRRIIRMRAIKRRKGRRSGHGSRKGSFEARTGNTQKMIWIRTIRPQRQMISELKKSGAIGNETYKRLYKLSKGGVFRSRKHLELYMKEHGMAFPEKTNQKGTEKTGQKIAGKRM